MSGYYQLLCGIHSEYGKIFTAGDIVESKANLPQKFGSNKFRKLSDEEVAEMKTDEPAAEKQPKRKRIKAKRKSA